MAKLLGLFAVTAVLFAGVAPASAEFFGCNEPRTKVSYSNAAYRAHYAQAPRQRSFSYSSQNQRRVAPQWRSSQWH